MSQVREGVDQVDRELVALLARRFGYMDAAARIKPERSAVRDEARKAQVIAQARAAAVPLRLPDALVADLWERLVEASIAYELAAFDRADRLSPLLRRQRGEDAAERADLLARPGWLGEQGA